MTQPLISVLMPAYKAKDTIRRAIESILECSVRDRVQIAVSIDDGEDYCATLQGLPVTLGEAGHHSGAGAARNRALAVAKGEYITMLDADDTVSPGYLDRMLPLASEQGACYSVTEYRLDGQFVRRIPHADDSAITARSLMLGLGSIHSLTHRSLLDPYRHTLTQDVVAEALIVHRLGGCAPLAQEALYTIHMSLSSVCGSSAQERFRSAHLSYHAEGHEAFHDIFSYRATTDHLYSVYLSSGGQKMFQQWVADHMDHTTSSMVEAALQTTQK